MGIARAVAKVYFRGDVDGVFEPQGRRSPRNTRIVATTVQCDASLSRGVCLCARLAGYRHRREPGLAHGQRAGGNRHTWRSAGGCRAVNLAWRTACVGMRVILDCDWTLRRTGAVAVVTGVTW